MRNGFLDNLPDLGISSAKRRKKKKVDQKQAVRYPVVVRYVRPKCPRCKSERVPVYHSKKNNPIRYHKCSKCGFKFKSVEV